jgi:hypothetical protein
MYGNLRAEGDGFLISILTNSLNITTSSLSEAILLSDVSEKSLSLSDSEINIYPHRFHNLHKTFQAKNKIKPLIIMNMNNVHIFFIYLRLN